MPKPRKILDITARGVADFRRQFDAQIAEAQRVAGVPILPPAGSASEAALVQALADMIEAQCVIQSSKEQSKAA